MSEPVADSDKKLKRGGDKYENLSDDPKEFKMAIHNYLS